VPRDGPAERPRRRRRLAGPAYRQTGGVNAWVPVPRKKSPWAAAALSALVPGLGHIYLGHYPRGFTYLAGFGGLEFFGFDLDLTAVGAVVGVPMELGGIGLWLYGIADAWRLARAMNGPTG